MQLIIDFDAINDSSKKEWLISTLKFMDIDFQTNENRQTVDDYNREIEEAEREIESGEYITATDLKNEARSW